MSAAATAASIAAGARGAAPAHLLPLLREVNDLKRIRSAGRPSSIAHRLFAAAWSRLAAGEDAERVAAATTAGALADAADFRVRNARRPERRVQVAESGGRERRSRARRATSPPPAPRHERATRRRAKSRSAIEPSRPAERMRLRSPERAQERHQRRVAPAAPSSPASRADHSAAATTGTPSQSSSMRSWTWKACSGPWPFAIIGALKNSDSCSCTPALAALLREVEHARDLDHERRGEDRCPCTGS